MYLLVNGDSSTSSIVAFIQKYIKETRVRRIHLAPTNPELCISHSFSKNKPNQVMLILTLTYSIVRIEGLPLLDGVFAVVLYYACQTARWTKVELLLDTIAIKNNLWRYSRHR